MSGFKNSDDFNELLSTGAKAREALLEKFRAWPGTDDPAVKERQAVRSATSQARDARKAARVDHALGGGNDPPRRRGGGTKGYGGS
jgi:hypothetical protein